MGSYAAHAASERERLRARKEIERLRRQVEEWRAGLERLRRLDLSGDDGPEVTLLTLAADEIERLRDENEALQALYERTDELQSLVDAWVKTFLALHISVEQFNLAGEALLPAATPKEDDRG